jgi:TRAP-type mannitol/chloroaromatic compound transport system substrate-binding protein
MESSVPEPLGPGQGEGTSALPMAHPDSDSSKRSQTSPRRRFIARASGIVAAAAVSTIPDAPSVIAQAKVQWRLSTAYPAMLDVLHGAALQLAKVVEETSGGRFRIEVFPGGQIMDPYACFDGAAQGSIQAFMASSWTWAAKEPAFSWFGTIPFGMNGEGMTAWCYQGDGLKLWEEAYGVFNLVPRPSVPIAPQMAGWFRKKITTIGDFKGLKMRIAGLGGPVITRAGGTTVATPASEIYAALERGVIDAAEWIGPHDDMKLGLHRTARYYYYYPGGQDSGTLIVFGFNKKAYEALPVDLRRTLDYATAAVHTYALADFHTKNAMALERLKTDFKGKVEVLPCRGPRCAICGSCRPRSSARSRRRAQWRKRCMRPSRSSRRRWAPGIGLPRARTSNSSQGEEGSVTTERRRFIATASGVAAAVAGSTIVDAPYVIAQPKVQWRMSTAWPRSLDVQLTAEYFAKIVEEMSGGRFRIEVFAGGQIMPPLECFDAASKGTIEAFMAAPFYWAQREPAIQWFQIQIPAPVVRELKKFAAEAIREESEKTPMARKVHASFTKFQALVGPWDRIAEGAYHQLVAG